MKFSPLIAAILAAVTLTIQQFVIDGVFDFKVIGFAALIVAIGTAGSFLKGKGTTLAGIIGTVLYTFYTVYNSGNFSWNEFIVMAILAVLMLLAPTLNPEPDTST